MFITVCCTGSATGRAIVSSGYSNDPIMAEFKKIWFLRCGFQALHNRRTKSDPVQNIGKILIFTGSRFGLID